MILPVEGDGDFFLNRENPLVIHDGLDVVVVDGPVTGLVDGLCGDQRHQNQQKQEYDDGSFHGVSILQTGHQSKRNPP